MSGEPTEAVQATPPSADVSDGATTDGATTGGATTDGATTDGAAATATGTAGGTDAGGTGGTTDDTTTGGGRRRPLGLLAGPRARWVAGAVLIVVALLLPQQLDAFHVGQLTKVLIFAVALLGLNLLVGITGQISLGHGAFFAIGAYTTAIMIDRYDVPYLATLPIAAGVTLLVGLLIGVPVLRLRGLYLALVTLAIAVFMVPLLKRTESLTGGSMGLRLDPAKSVRPPGWTGLAEDQWLYYLTLTVAAVLFLVAGSLLRSRVGRALQAIRDNETAAETMGIRLPFYKTVVFAWSAMYAGVAGCLATWMDSYVSPDSFPVDLSITLLMGLVVGGLGSLAGPVLGGFFVQFVPDLAQKVNDAAPGVISGLLIIAVMYVAPTGLAGLVKRGVRSIRKHL